MRLLQERRAVRPPVSGPSGSRPPLGRRLIAVPLLAAAVVAADQVSKTWALHHALGRHVLWTLWFDLTVNSGAAFGLGTGVTPVVEAAVVVVVIGLLVMGRRVARASSWPMSIALGLIVGGAAGNLTDRAFRHIPHHPGAVIDFIAVARVGQHDWWPVFNVADSCIVIGAFLLALSISRRGRASTPADGPPDPVSTDG